MDEDFSLIKNAESWGWRNDVFWGGGPQRSTTCPGPILFICYINDMPDLIASFIFMYADDAKLFTCSKQRAVLQRYLDMLGERSCTSMAP